MRPLPREVSHDVRFREVELRCEKPLDASLERVLQVAARSHFPEEVHAKYFREEDYSVVQTVLQITSEMKPFFTFRGRVLVRIKYEGDMVRSDTEARQWISARIDELGQRCCAQFVLGHVLLKTDAVPFLPP